MRLIRLKKSTALCVGVGNIDVSDGRHLLSTPLSIDAAYCAWLAIHSDPLQEEVPRHVEDRCLNWGWPAPWEIRVFPQLLAFLSFSPTLFLTLWSICSRNNSTKGLYWDIFSTLLQGPTLKTIPLQKKKKKKHFTHRCTLMKLIAQWPLLELFLRAKCLYCYRWDEREWVVEGECCKHPHPLPTPLPAPSSFSTKGKKDK